jgi:hypothetical protein
MNEDQVKKNKKVVQFKYRNYQEVLAIKDHDAEPTRSGQRQNCVIKARNWKQEFDLDDPKQKEQFDALMKSSQRGVSFWVLDDVDKRKDKIAGRAETLAKLIAMHEAQLVTMLSREEFADAGINPGRATKMELVMAIIDSKKLG